MINGLKKALSESFDESEGELAHNDLYKSVIWYITIYPKDFTTHWAEKSAINAFLGGCRVLLASVELICHV